MLRGAEGDLAADAAGGAGDDDHAARQEGRAAHDRGRRRGVQFALREHERFLHFDKTTTDLGRKKMDCFAKHEPGMSGFGWLQPGRNFLST